MDSEDTVKWALTSSGEFTIKSAWSAIRRTSPPTSWSTLIWFHGNIPRAAFILWLAFKAKLSTHDRFSNPQVDTCCLLCNEVPESHHHLFFDCPLSMQIWRNILRKMDVIVPHLPWDALIAWLSSNWTGSSLSCRIHKLCLAATISSIWQERNIILHENRCQTAGNITHKILETVRLRLSSYKSVQNNELNRKLQHDWALPDSIYAL